jgi:hypothetical protein
MKEAASNAALLLDSRFDPEDRAVSSCNVSLDFRRGARRHIPEDGTLLAIAVITFRFNLLFQTFVRRLRLINPLTKKLKTKLSFRSPRANDTDRETAACR